MESKSCVVGELVSLMIFGILIRLVYQWLYHRIGG